MTALIQVAAVAATDHCTIKCR